MAYRGRIYRWETYWADLEPHVGTEQAGERRPVLVVSNDDANATFGTVTVIPLTKLEGKGRSPRFFEVTLPDGTVPNGFTPLALPHQIRSISKRACWSGSGSWIWLMPNTMSNAESWSTSESSSTRPIEPAGGLLT